MSCAEEGVMDRNMEASESASIATEVRRKNVVLLRNIQVGEHRMRGEGWRTSERMNADGCMDTQ